LTYSFLFWAICMAFVKDSSKVVNNSFRRFLIVFFSLLCLQIFFGAIVSGMRAALYYPSWPDLNGSFLPSVLFQSDAWTLENVKAYDSSPLMPALIHVLHRNLGYLVYALGIYLTIKVFRYPLRKLYYRNNLILLITLNLQVILGILVLLNTEDSIPVFFGVMHQAIAIFILSTTLLNLYLFRKR